MGDFPTLPSLKDLPFDATSQVLFECGKVSTDSTCYKCRFVMHVNVFDDYENCKELFFGNQTWNKTVVHKSHEIMVR